MDNKVFHIDKECFILYLDRFSHEYNTFIKIGSSEILKDYIPKLNFVTLLTKLVTFSPEIELLLNKKEHRVIGLKEDVNKYLSFINSLQSQQFEYVLVEEASEIEKKESEKEFLNKIKRNEKIKEHSFASFYKDGNIRVFTAYNIIFDLLEKLKENKNLKFELEYLIESFASYYKEVYKKIGFITSNNTFFFFSNNSFICIAQDNNWIKDTIRVGINLFNINTLVLNYNFKPDAYSLKIFSTIEKENGLDVIINPEIDDTFKYLFLTEKVRVKSFDEEIEKDINGVKYIFKDKKIDFIFNDFIFSINNIDDFLFGNKNIFGKYKTENFKIIVDNFEKDSYTVFDKHPLLITEILNKDDYIESFWNNFEEKTKNNFNRFIFENDYSYTPNFISSLEVKNFYEKLFVETVRRIVIEGEENINSEEYSMYKDFLKDFNGEYITKNGFLIGQQLGWIPKKGKIGIRDIFLSTSTIFLVDKTINPLLIFEDEYEIEELEEKIKEYRSKYKKNMEDSVDDKITVRYKNILENKRFFKYERDRLERFLKDIEIELKRKAKQLEKEEKKEPVTIVTDSTIVFGEQQKTTISEQMEYKSGKEEKKVMEKVDKIDKKGIKKEKVKRKLSFVFLYLTIIVIISFIALYFFRVIRIQKLDNFLKNKFNLEFFYTQNKEKKSTLSQEEFLKRNNEKYHPDDSSLKSKHYKFSMTLLDHIALVNEVALKNGYHKLVPQYLKAKIKGKDPDWIYPGNTFLMPDNSVVTVVSGDTLWGICEKYVISEINRHEELIRELIEKTKKEEITLDEAKEGFKKIFRETHSQMMKDVIKVLLSLENFDEWEPYLDKTAR